MGRSLYTRAVNLLAEMYRRAKYGRDVYPKGAIFIAFVRCPYGNATLDACDEDSARSIPGSRRPTWLFCWLRCSASPWS